MWLVGIACGDCRFVRWCVTDNTVLFRFTWRDGVPQNERSYIIIRSGNVASNPVVAVLAANAIRTIDRGSIATQLHKLAAEAITLQQSLLSLQL